MTNLSKSIVVLAVLMFCSVVFTGVSATADDAEKKPEDKYADVRVLVEAFVVEVKLSALYESEVNPIGERPNVVSITKLLWCLKSEDTGQVTSGVRVAVKQDSRGRVKIEERRYIARVSGDKGRSYDSYDQATKFETRTHVMPDGVIRTSYEFSQNLVGEPEGDVPPAMVSREWEGEVTLQAGKPSIVGSAQDEDKAVFLVICADICK